MGNGALKEFDDIRPYTDDEIGTVLKRLVKDKVMIKILSHILWQDCPPFLKPLLRLSVKSFMQWKTKRIRTIHQFQMEIVMKMAVSWVIKNSISSITQSGLEELSDDLSYLFISNHRDIVLDSALLNYLRLSHGLYSSEIAFGDNLLMNDTVSDIIKINKSFVVKRGLPLRQQLRESLHLSRYIWYTLNQGNSVWLAQREGRAKDGDDRTNPSIIKMLALSQRKGGLEFSDFINRCRVLPLAISYEFDPCDALKAQELYIKQTTGSYTKSKDEDLKSIITGFTGFKGRIHLTFGKPLNGVWEDAKAVAAALDSTIHTSYKFWPSNYISYDITHKTNKYQDHYSPAEKESFVRRIKSYPENLHSIVYANYARPVENREVYENATSPR